MDTAKTAQESDCAGASVHGIDGVRFSKSMPQWPHWYVIRQDGGRREFDFIDHLIKKFGYSDKWGSRNDYYLVIGKFKYWVIEGVLNRATPISNAEIRKRGDRYLARHGMKIGPWKANQR